VSSRANQTRLAAGFIVAPCRRPRWCSARGRRGGHARVARRFVACRPCEEVEAVVNSPGSENAPERVGAVVGFAWGFFEPVVTVMMAARSAKALRAPMKSRRGRVRARIAVGADTMRRGVGLGAVQLQHQPHHDTAAVDTTCLSTPLALADPRAAAPVARPSLPVAPCSRPRAPLTARPAGSEKRPPLSGPG